MIDPNNECILFIDEDMAKLLIAVRRTNSQDPNQLAKIINKSRGQINDMLSQATTVGALNPDNTLSAVAEQCVNQHLQRRVNEMTA
jgi:hypothetical protein